MYLYYFNLPDIGQRIGGKMFIYCENDIYHGNRCKLIELKHLEWQTSNSIFFKEKKWSWLIQHDCNQKTMCHTGQVVGKKGHERVWSIFIWNSKIILSTEFLKSMLGVKSLFYVVYLCSLKNLLWVQRDFFFSL